MTARRARSSSSTFKRLALLCSTALASAAFVAAPAYAQSWTGAASPDWFNAANWSPNGVPTAGGNVSIDTQTPNPAVVDVGGQTVTVNQVLVGQSNTGTLTIQKGQGGGTLKDTVGIIGDLAGSNGAVTVQGGATWTNTNSLSVGFGGTGTLNVVGLVNAPSVVAGVLAGSAGFVTVDGGFLNANQLALIGGFGTGTLTIQNGGSVLNNLGIVGDSAGASGAVVVTGSGSTWNNGDVTIGNFGAGALTIQNGAAVNNNNGFVAAGAGSTGTVVVDAATWNSAGQLHIGEGGAGTLTIQNGGSVSSVFGAVVGFLANSSGTVNVTGAGSTWTNGSGLEVGGFGAGTLTIQNGGLVSSQGSDLGFFAGSVGTVLVDNGTWTISGTLAVGDQGSGILTIQNGGTVNTGFAVVGSSPGSTGSVLVNNGILNNSGTLAVGFLGAGTLTLQNGGTVNTGAVQLATMAGSTAVLNIGADPGSVATAPGTLNTPSITIGAGNAQINFNHTSTNYAFAPALSGNGTLNQYAGTTILTGDSSGFTGSTNVVGGKLVVNGSLANSDVVMTGGIVGGNGTVGTLLAGAGATVAPGNSIGTLNVVGNATFAAGSIYQVEANAAGQSDKILAGGTATINGGTVQVLAGAGNYALYTTYTILTATGGRSGAFDAVTSNLAFLDPTLSYDPNNVYLTLTRNNTDFAAIGQTRNQIATGGGTESLGYGNTIYNAVLNLSATQARYAFDQLSGEVHASAKTALIEDSRFVREAAVDRLRAAFDAVGAVHSPVMSYAADDRLVPAPATTDRVAVWARGFGAFGHWNGDGNAATLKRDTGGLLVGADGWVDRWRVGLLGGYSRTTFNVKDRSSSGTSDNYHVGLYGGTRWGDLAFRSGAAYTWHELSTSRSVVFPGFADRLTASYNAGTAQVFGEFGYGLKAGRFALEPFANLAYVNLATGGFTEKGGAAALTGFGSDTSTTFSTLGLRGSTDVALGGVVGTARATLGWRHAYGTVSPLSTLAFAGSSPFTIAGVPIARDAAVLDAGLDLNLSAAAVLGVSYGGQFAPGVLDQTVRANLTVKF
ncbi:autotransporter domain-containing protein [Bradyrhizobium sp. CCGUVB23]|uniref:autotransporter domain-containing protein n=1 Tax=Bradyrhizobium sp. CCGUVB23 TaxID=2949630 RepID=UPI0020B1F7C2|nr:autotransporter domain-containing protein [Bradyrhizobium sp. CCGUVB23]MCP3465935.1 autotransporter domain-containing protein [Bradyrhizobium sp. CCGUVB23]